MTNKNMSAGFENGTLDGNAIVYCEGSFNTTYGKTAHGLVRFTWRYKVLSVLDSRYAGQDAGFVLDGKTKGIPIFASLREALTEASSRGTPATHFVIGLAPDGGILGPEAKVQVLEAVRAGLNVDSGLHHFLSEDPEISVLAENKGVKLRDVRRVPSRRDLHGFTGKIEEVTSFTIALLGTDSAVGKRTTAWILKDQLDKAGIKTEMIGTGQTAWLQGVRYGIILDSLVNDFVAGEIEHAVWTAWKEQNPRVMILEGQGSLLNPAYPGGFELMAAGRPKAVIMQHAPARKEYDGFPGYPLHPLEKQIKAVEFLYDIPVIGITINHEDLPKGEIPRICREISKETGLPVCDPLVTGMEEIVNIIKKQEAR